jgi:hypothetical protein
MLFIRVYDNLTVLHKEGELILLDIVLNFGN